MAKPTTVGIAGTGIKAAVRDLFAIYASVKAVKNTDGNGVPLPDDGSLAILGTDANEIAQILDVEGQPVASAAPLGATATYTSGIFLTQGFARIIGSVFANVAGTLNIDQSPDGQNWDATNTIAVTAATATPVSVEIVCPFARLRYVNGAGAQTTFRLNAFLRRI